MEDLVVVKIGGAILEDDNKLDFFLKQFNAIDKRKILVHGGGKTATNLEKKLNIVSDFHEGRRITSKESLDVIVMVYAGLINKKVVANLNAVGAKAVGLTGADGSLIISNKREIINYVDFGFVGDPIKSNTSLLKNLLNDSYVPVIAPVTFDNKGQLLNTNADSIAGFIGIELSSFYNVKINYCFEFDGVLSNKNDEFSIISNIRKNDLNKLITDGVIEGGMIPKITNALNAVQQGVTCVKIMSYKQLKNYEGEIGTTIY